MRWTVLTAAAVAVATATLTAGTADAAPRARVQAYEAYPGAPVVAQGRGARRVVRTTRRVVRTTTGRAPTRLTVVRERSFLDPGTEVLPLSRPYLDYALPPTNNSYPSSTWDVANTFRFPLPGSTTELYPFYR